MPVNFRYFSKTSWPSLLSASVLRSPRGSTSTPASWDKMYHINMQWDSQLKSNLFDVIKHNKDKPWNGIIMERASVNRAWDATMHSNQILTFMVILNYIIKIDIHLFNKICTESTHQSLVLISTNCRTWACPSSSTEVAYLTINKLSGHLSQVVILPLFLPTQIWLKN